MFDTVLHREYIFLSYLLGLLPPDEKAELDLEGKLQLEYYKLQKTFEGAIELEQTPGVYEPASAKSAVGQEQKQPLDEIIEKINEQYKGIFTEADRVMLGSIVTSMMADEKANKLARSSDPKIFMDSVLPKLFGDIAMDSYMDAETQHTEMQNAYKSLFEDKAKYKAFMGVMAEMMYRFFRGTV
jgi:type I restriction enzyme R subunit